MINKQPELWGWLGKLSIICGCLFIFYNAGALYKSHFSPAEQPDASVPQTVMPTNYQEGEKIGTLYLPTAKKIIPIFEGTTNAVLKKGAGHFSASSMPGEANNSVISGHRDTYFRVLKDVHPKDILYIKTADGIFYYKVRKIDIVSADNQNILTPKPRGILTLTTCYPFYYIGDAPKRYIITADLLN